MAPPPHFLALPLITLLPLLTTVLAAVNSSILDLLTQSPSQNGNLCDQLIIPNGYPCHQHSVQTKDGYILALQRVSSSSSSLKLSSGRRPPVLLLHGIFVAGDSWFLNPKEESLGFILADRGFDVWAANFRGTRWSGSHVSRANDTKEYWDWSWEELALYDLPAMIEYIYQETDSKVFVVGHSQGTTVSLAAFTQPNVVQKVEAAAFLSPISYLGHVNAPIVQRMVSMYLDKMILEMGFHQLNFRSAAGAKLLVSVCDGHLDCSDLLATATGKNCCFNNSRMDLYIEYVPHPISAKNINHLFQMIRQATFAKYDYGRLKNLQLYGSEKPPIFNLSLIPESLPVWMAYGRNDALADVTDVQRTIMELPCKKEVLYLNNYGHADFLLGVSGKEDIYRHMIEFFSSWGKSSRF